MSISFYLQIKSVYCITSLTNNLVLCQDLAPDTVIGKQGKAQNRCCRKPSNRRISLETTTPIGHAGSRQILFEACSAQWRVKSCAILFSRSAPTVEIWNQWEHQRASEGVFREGERDHESPRGLHSMEIPRTESSS